MWLMVRACQSEQSAEGTMVGLNRFSCGFGPAVPAGVKTCKALRGGVAGFFTHGKHTFVRKFFADHP
jgi:hypothetical protein